MKRLLLFGTGVLTGVIISITAFGTYYSAQDSTPQEHSETNAGRLTGTAPSPDDIDEKDLHRATNEYRKTRKLNPLAYSINLASSAKDKCRDMSRNNYIAHTRPDGTEFAEGILKYEPALKKAGESLAYGQLSAEQVVKEWVASTEHRKSLVDKEFDSVGYAVCLTHDRNAILIVQHFADL